MTLAPWVSDGAANLGKWIFGTRPDRDFFVHAHCESQPIERLRTKHRYARSAADIDRKCLPFSTPHYSIRASVVDLSLGWFMSRCQESSCSVPPTD